MNKNCIQSGINYFRGALYIKLIVNNVKYGGIHYNYGQLTKVLFIIPESLHCAAQNDANFIQYMHKGQVFNPAHAGILKNVDFNLLVNKQFKGLRWSLLTAAISSQSPLKNGTVVIGFNTINEIYLFAGRQTIQPVDACEVNLTPCFQMSRGVKAGFAHDNSKKHNAKIQVLQIQKFRNSEIKEENELIQDFKELVTCSQHAMAIGVATGKNSTGFNKTRSSASSSRFREKASLFERKGDQQLRLDPAIIYFSREELAIRACDLLRFFNN